MKKILKNLKRSKQISNNIIKENKEYIQLNKEELEKYHNKIKNNTLKFDKLINKKEKISKEIFKYKKLKENNIKNMNKNIYFIFICIIILIHLSYSFQRKINKINLNFISEITITINEKGKKYILNNEATKIGDNSYTFDNLPSQILINGKIQNYISKEVNLNESENNITMIWDTQLTNCNVMFADLKNIVKIDLTKFDFSKVKGMAGMFSNCNGLTSIKFGNLETSSVTDMQNMFSGCSSLILLDLSKFNTLLVKNMKNMFRSCTLLKSLDLNNFKTPSLENMEFMFTFCSSLTSINISNLDTSLVTSMTWLFFKCSSLESLDINFNLSSLKTLTQAFSECSSLKTFNANFMNTSNIINMYRLFYKCNSLTTLDLSSLHTSSVSDMRDMFYGCNSLISLNIENFETSKVEYMNNMFYGCYSLISLKLDNFDTSSVTSMSNIFSGGSEETIYCINKDKTPDIFQNLNSMVKNIKNDCNDICFTKDKKLVPKDKKCSSNCPNEYMYEYKGICYESCPIGTYSYNENYICQILKINFSYSSSSEVTESLIEDKIVTESIELLNNSLTEDKLNSEILNDTLIDNTIFNTLLNYSLTDSTIKNNIFNNSLSEKVIINDSFSENIIMNNLSSLDIIIGNITNNIINGNINLKNLINGEKDDIIIKEENTILEITTSTNQKNKQYNNISTINLGGCENILKKIYDINESLPLIIFKIDYFVSEILIPVIGYEVFDPINKTKLNLTYCQNEHINLDIPVSIDEDNLFKYEPDSEYYNDVCFPYTTNNGTDILLNDRHNEYNNNNLSLCENNCIFNGYNQETKKANCECEIKTHQIKESEIKEDKNILLSNNFTNQDLYTNMVTMKCYNTLFTKNGIFKNIGNYIIISSIIIFIILAILFYKVGFPLLEEKIQQILKSKIKIGKIRNNVKESTTRTIHKKNKKKKGSNFKNVKNPTKKTKKIKNKEINNSKSGANISTKFNSKLENSKNVMIYKNINKNIHKREKDVNIYSKKIKKVEIFNNSYNDCELNSLTYMQALKYDKRSFFAYYMSLIMEKHPLMFLFCPKVNYNSKIIQLSIFLIFAIINYAINALFFNGTTIHKIYIDEGIYNFKYLIPKILYSFIISHTIYILMIFLFLSEKNLLKIKNEITFKKSNDIISKITKTLVVKYICFYCIGFAFLLIFWYYLSSLGSVFQNTQYFIIKNALISIGISILYPFFINLIPAILRLISLKDKNENKEFLYKISKIIQIL